VDAAMRVCNLLRNCCLWINACSSLWSIFVGSV